MGCKDKFVKVVLSAYLVFCAGMVVVSEGEERKDFLVGLNSVLLLLVEVPKS